MKSRSRAVLLVAVVLTVPFASALAADERKASSPPESSAKKPLDRRGAKPVVIMETSEGTVTIELWRDKAPRTVENFLRYTDEKFYDGTIFHRVIDGFMIQGGGFTEDMKEKKMHEPIKNEARADVPNKRGTLAMARTQVVDSATAQFFINLKDNGFLNHRDETATGYGYAVFGKVIEGMDVVDKIAKVPTGTAGAFSDVPKKSVVIKRVRQAERKGKNGK